MGQLGVSQVEGVDAGERVGFLSPFFFFCGGNFVARFWLWFLVLLIHIFLPFILVLFSLWVRGGRRDFSS